MIVVNSSLGAISGVEKKRAGTQFAGRQAFTAISAQGYHVGAIGVPFMAHRVVWAFVHGCWPTEQIDHINRIKTDNRIANLREASRRQNGKNRKPHKGGSSQFLGVHYIPDRGKWGAAIMADGTQIRVGTFDTEIEAAVARDRAAADMHGDFASLNFPEMGQPS